MAHMHNHARTRTAAPSWRARSVNKARRFEGMVERHWPFAAYALATLATAGYVLGQLADVLN